MWNKAKGRGGETFLRRCGLRFCRAIYFGLCGLVSCLAVKVNEKVCCRMVRIIEKVCCLTFRASVIL